MKSTYFAFISNMYSLKRMSSEQIFSLVPDRITYQEYLEIVGEDIYDK